MQILSVNIGKAEIIQPGHAPSGMNKRPVEGWVKVAKLGLQGDVQVNRKHHGGPEQAVYVYTQPDYDWWTKALQRDLRPGLFGENLTLSDRSSQELFIGDRLVIGEVVLEITSPRIGCNTFEAWIGLPGFRTWFDREARPGAYCRVLQPGSIRVGQKVDYQPYAGEQVSVSECLQLIQSKTVSVRDLQRMLAVPISSKHQGKFRQRLAESGLTSN